ncbi:MAG: ferrochelatase, partial [Pseudomonadota bacterium]|nr:ferrochelatase [Pseudomonadota bacterium]
VLGPRRVKSQTEIRRELAAGAAAEDMVLEWDSKVDHFDKRLQLWQRMADRERGARLLKEEVHHLSLFEFYWKFYVDHRQIVRSGKPVCLMVTPAFSADCIETLEEINEEIKESFEHAGGEKFTYIPCLNDDDAHIAALTGQIEANLKGWLD